MRSSAQVLGRPGIEAQTVHSNKRVAEYTCMISHKRDISVVVGACMSSDYFYFLNKMGNKVIH